MFKSFSHNARMYTYVLAVAKRTNHKWARENGSY